jgi:hypothetical protein
VVMAEVEAVEVKVPLPLSVMAWSFKVTAAASFLLTLQVVTVPLHGDVAACPGTAVFIQTHGGAQPGPVVLEVSATFSPMVAASEAGVTTPRAAPAATSTASFLTPVISAQGSHRSRNPSIDN